MNLLYFVVHDLGRHLPVYGVPVASPRLAEFAQESIVFNNMFCASPACSPSRACAMTGLHARRNGCIGLAHVGYPLPATTPTIVDYLNRAGYETILSGINHETLPRQSRYATDLTLTWSHWRADQAVANAIHYLENRADDRPFYCNIATQHPHPGTWGSFDPVPQEEIFVPAWCPDSPFVRDQLGRFQASIRFMDHHFGRLRDALEKLGLLDNTLVVFTTDHGIAVPRAKPDIYDRGTEIAFLARLPEAAHAGTRNDALLSNIDLVPTFLDWLGVPVPAGLDGKSFLPALRGEPFAGHDAIFTERNFHGESIDAVRSIRTRTHHFLRNLPPSLPAGIAIPPFDAETLGRQPLAEFSLEDIRKAWPAGLSPRPKEELYDLVRDPEEFHNLAADPAAAAVRDELRARLDAWLAATGDYALAGNPPPPETAPHGWGDPALWPVIPS